MAGLGAIEANYFKSGLLYILSYSLIFSTKCKLMFPDVAGGRTNMVPTDDKGLILIAAIY